VHVVLVARDGARRAIAHSGAPIKDKTGNVRGTVLVFRDVSERMRLEDEIFRTRKLESLAVLAGRFAHDFNNMLTSVMTNLFVARMRIPSGSETSELLSEAERTAFQASALTKQLQSFSASSTFIKERFSIRELIEETAGFCLSGSHVDYHLDLADTLCDIEADRGQIDQALGAIITNAYEAMGSDGTVGISARDAQIERNNALRLQEGTYVSISISDQGPGIPHDALTKIYDPYFTTKPNASGLGLTTAYSIVTRHGGCIDVALHEGAGSTFTVYLPACKKPEEGGEPEETATRKGKVLLMDDEDYIRKSTGKLLNHLGYDTVTAADGEEAIALYNEARDQGEPFDLVILDLAIPGGVSGKETMKRLLETDPDVKAVVSTGYTNNPVVRDYRSYGFCGVITKPFEIEELSRLLQEAMGGERRG
jgi:signal transduction histidine kinase/ActR/RegA family two-component response regulator